MMSHLKKNNHVDIILPNEIGDSIIALPLLNNLILNNANVNILQCSKFHEQLISHFFGNKIRCSKIMGNENLIDFRCDENWINAQEEISSYKFSLGYGDWDYVYSKYLKLPNSFKNQSATKIYHQVMDYFLLNDYEYNFNSFQNWSNDKQEYITLIPGNGHKSRSLDMSYYTHFYNKFSSQGHKVKFLFGPQEKEYLTKYSKQFHCYYSNSVFDFYLQMDQSKFIIANEGGGMHMACIYGVPCIAIFNSCRPLNWFPYYNSLQSAIDLGNSFTEPFRFLPNRNDLFQKVNSIINGHFE